MHTRLPTTMPLAGNTPARILEKSHVQLKRIIRNHCNLKKQKTIETTHYLSRNESTVARERAGFVGQYSKVILAYTSPPHAQREISQTLRCPRLLLLLLLHAGKKARLGATQQCRVGPRGAGSALSLLQIIYMCATWNGDPPDKRAARESCSRARLAWPPCGDHSRKHRRGATRPLLPAQTSSSRIVYIESHA